MTIAEERPVETSPDPRRARILEGAKKVFLAYGFSRTTMDDIAREVEISRPALYLHFKNKTEIYRGIAESLMDCTFEQAKATLAGPGTFAERLNATVECAFLNLVRHVGDSPHGPELLDMKNTLAGDLVANCRSRLAAEITAAVAAEAKKTGFDLKANGLTASGIADILLDGLEGIRSRTSDPVEQARVARSLITVIALALST